MYVFLISSVPIRQVILRRGQIRGSHNLLIFDLCLFYVKWINSHKLRCKINDILYFYKTNPVYLLFNRREFFFRSLLNKSNPDIIILRGKRNKYHAKRWKVIKMPLNVGKDRGIMEFSKCYQFSQLSMCLLMLQNGLSYQI